jgi:NAD(P)-dependent dehydrogenase (short-subunit alcohol dehydrogenase family)
MILIFGSTGFVGTSVTNHFKNKGKTVTEVTRKEYDMTDPNNLSGLNSYNDIEAVVWCSGFNQNDSIGSLNYETYDTSMNVNANSIVKSLDYLLSNNKIRSGARLCIISSILEERGRVNKLSYSVSKSAISGIVKASSITLYEQGILINSILPGPIDNEMTRNTLSKDELEKMTPYFVNIDDICRMCYLLCFENTSITGQSIKIDNGITSKIIYA